MDDKNKIIAALAFAGGVIIGANWNRIKNFSGIVVKKTSGIFSARHKSARKFLAVQNEHVQDLLAESKAKKRVKG